MEKLKKVCAVLEALVQEGEARQAQQGADTDPSSEESIRSMAVSEITEAPIQEQQVAAREAQAAATSKGSARARRERKKYAEGKPTRSQQAKIRKSSRLSREIWLRLHGPHLWRALRIGAVVAQRVLLRALLHLWRALRIELFAVVAQRVLLRALLLYLHLHRQRSSRGRWQFFSSMSTIGLGTDFANLVAVLSRDVAVELPAFRAEPRALALSGRDDRTAGLQ